MNKEAVEDSPITTLEGLARHTEEQWEQNWQNLDFVKRFPKLATRLVSEGKAKLPDDDQKSMVELSLTTFMRLSWKLGEQGSITGSALLLDKNLDLTRTHKGEEGAGLEPTGESLMRCNIGAFILLGKSLDDKEWINNIVSESYQQLNSGKQNNFRQHILRLAIKDSFFRNWVKAHSLDTQNGFEWNREMAKLFLQLLASDSVNKFPVAFSEDLKIYPLEVVDEFVGHALKYVRESPTIGKKASSKYANPSVFITRLQELYKSGYFDESPLSLQVQGKIANLNALIENKPT